MEFTKEEIETAKKIYEQYATDKFNEPISTSYIHYLNSLLKPETKKHTIEVEYDDGDIDNLIKIISRGMKRWGGNIKNLKVTKLPEGTWTDHHMKLFALYYMPDCKNNLEDSFSNFKAERKSELGK